jgi:hypothetical protein
MTKKLASLSSFVLLGLIAGCGGGMEGGTNASDMTENQTGAPRESVYCEAVEQRVSPQDCEDLTRADAEVRTGSAAWTAPEPMRRGETFEVHLIIDRRSPKEIRVIEGPLEDFPGEVTGNASGDDPSADNTTSPGEEIPHNNSTAPDGEEPAPTPGQIIDPLEGRTERFSPPVGRHMRAELIGEGFDIAAETDASQQIPLGSRGNWIWKVTARKGGAQPLTLITVVEGVVEGRRFVLARTPRVRTVTVEVSLKDRIWDALIGAPPWIKAITAIVVAIGSLLTAIYAVPWRRRRKAAKAAEKPDGADGAGEGEPPPGGGPGA